MTSIDTASAPGGLDRIQPTAGEDAHTIMVNRVSWGAIFAGVVVGLVVQVLLTMLGVGIGAATIDPATNGSPAASTFSMASGIWYVVSGIIAAFAGGYIAARMSGKTVATTGALHGLTTWAFTTLLVLYLLSTAVGSIVGGTFSGVAGAVGGLGQTVAQAAGPMLEDANPIDAIQNQIRATGNDPEALNTAAMNAMRALVTGDEAGADEARQQAAQALANARGIPLDQAQQPGRADGGAVSSGGRSGEADRDGGCRAGRLGGLDRRAAGVRGAAARRRRRLARRPVRGRASGLRRSCGPHPPAAGLSMGRDDAGRTLPLAEEKAAVSVREAVTGRVRVSTKTETFAEVVRQELRGMRAEVVRVPVNRTLEPGETPPEPRTEGEVMIIPIFEEVVVVEKRLVLKEELHITQQVTTETVEVPVELRRQRAVVERLPAETKPTQPRSQRCLTPQQ